MVKIMLRSFRVLISVPYILLQIGSWETFLMSVWKEIMESILKINSTCSYLSDQWRNNAKCRLELWLFGKIEYNSEIFARKFAIFRKLLALLGDIFYHQVARHFPKNDFFGKILFSALAKSVCRFSFSAFDKLSTARRSIFDFFFTNSESWEPLDDGSDCSLVAKSYKPQLSKWASIRVALPFISNLPQWTHE